MSKKIFQVVVLFAAIFMLSSTGAFAKAESSDKVTSHHLARMYHLKGKEVEAKFNDFVTVKMKEIGYKLTDPHRRVNDVYKKLYGSTDLDILSFLPVVNDGVVKPLFNIDPRLAGFNPFNMLIYKKLDEENYHVGHMTPEAILDIIGIEDPTVREEYTKSFEKLDKMLDDAFGKEHMQYLDYSKLPKKRMMNFELKFDRPEFIDDFVDEFEENFEDIFAQHSYVIAGFHNFIDEEEETVLNGNYDAFWTYSLCHMKYSSTVFDGKGARPEAGVFAPCTMYMFIPKGSDKLIIGMPRLENVKVALDIKDKVRTDFMDRLDQEIPQILEDMGAKEIQNINPLAGTQRAATPKAVSGAKAAAVSVKEIEITNKKLATMFLFKGNIEEKYNAFVKKAINKIGFKLTDPHERVNDVYKKKYGSTNLDVLSFMSIANEKAIKPLFGIDPRIAGFNPFNFLLYKKLDENRSHVGHLTANAILDMLSITDPKVREAYTESIAQLDDLVRKELGGEEITIEAKGYAKNRMMNFEILFKREGDIDDIIDEFQENFEGAFEDQDYIIAGFNNFKDGDEGALDGFDAFWTYSLCQFKFSYTVFDGEGGRPEGSLFAPCTMYMYIKKGDNKIVVGMPKLANWRSTLGINDKVRSAFIDKLDHEIPEIMTTKLGAQLIENTNPLIAIVPKKVTSSTVAEKKEAVVPSQPKKVKKVEAPVVKTEKPKPEVKKEQKATAPVEHKEGYKIQLPTPPAPVKALNVITVGGSDIQYVPGKEHNPHDHKIIFSERRPPDYNPNKLKEKKSTEQSENEGSMAGLPASGRVSAYLRAPFTDVENAKHQLEKAGFKIVGVSSVNKKGTLKTITFTSDDLLALAKKKNSAFTGVMRLLVDKVNNQISITNPLYFSRAYMGDNYDDKTVRKVVEKLNSAFKGLKNSKDKLKFTLLPKYRFMDGMPYYKDMVIVAKGAGSKVLLEKLKKKNGGKALQFVQQIGDDSYLVGVKLGKRTSKFIKKTGTNNASLLPYPVWIEKGVAKIMEPKYYISINYPMLKMSNFMKIATIPDAIRNDCEKLFK